MYEKKKQGELNYILQGIEGSKDNKDKESANMEKRRGKKERLLVAEFGYEMGDRAYIGPKLSGSSLWRRKSMK